MDHPKASITADTIIHAVDFDEVVLIKRKNEPFKDYWALPGGFFDPLKDESLDAAAWREAKEETGFDIEKQESPMPEFVGYFDAMNQDPRGRTITFAYYLRIPGKPELKAADDAKELQWFSVAEILSGKIPLAFDHDHILEIAFVK